MSHINVISKTQKIIVDPSGGSVGVVNAGPMGPRGLTGPSEASLVLVVDGQLLTRVGGVLTPISRASLAGDTAFSGLYVPKSILANDGELLTRAAGVVAPITRANLANDTAFTTKFAPLTSILGQAVGTATSWTNATTTASDITASTGAAPTLTLSLITTRLYKAVFVGRFFSTVANDLANISFNEGGVSRRAAIVECPLTNAISVHHEWLFNPASAASIVYKVQGARFSGTGTISGTASASTPFHFWIEDMG